MPIKRASKQSRLRKVFGHSGERSKTPLRAGLYAHVSTNDQQTLPMQIRALRDYAARHCWTVTKQIKGVGSGAALRKIPIAADRSFTASGDRCSAALAPRSLGQVGDCSSRHPAGTGAPRRRLRVAHLGSRRRVIRSRPRRPIRNPSSEFRHH